jgi:hypothetical protein
LATNAAVRDPYVEAAPHIKSLSTQADLEPAPSGQLEQSRLVETEGATEFGHVLFYDASLEWVDELGWNFELPS